MLYASSKEAFKKATGANIMIECSDYDDLEHERLLEKVK
jgi:hypothetical protein